jgi:hypothetical protein
MVASTVLGSAPALADTNADVNVPSPEHWGVITRNTIGSPVAALRDGPFGSFGVTGTAAQPPYGQGSLGIEVADHSTSLAPQSEKADFGNEVDFYGNPVLGLTKVGFHVFQTGENITYGGPTNMPNIRFEIDPNLTATDTYSTLVWVPDAAPVATTNSWSPFIDATSTGYWYLTGAAGTLTGCTQSLPHCSFADVKTRLDNGGDKPIIYSVAVGKGRDSMWIGAVDGLRINQNIYDFEADGVRTRHVTG